MAHLAHYKRSGAAPMLAHYERRAELERGYSRENIDSLRTAQNYAIGADSPQVLAAALRSRVADAIAAHEADSGKAVRRDANVLSDWVVTLPKDCPRQDARRFFEVAVDFCRERYGAENVLGGFVHMDEATPHAHIPVVPVRDGRLRSAKVFTRSDLRSFHKDLGRAGRGRRPGAARLGGAGPGAPGREAAEPPRPGGVPGGPRGGRQGHGEGRCGRECPNGGGGCPEGRRGPIGVPSSDPRGCRIHGGARPGRPSTSRKRGPIRWRKRTQSWREESRA